MEAHEAMKLLFSKQTKEAAYFLSTSQSLVVKWTEPFSDGGSGTYSPLYRLDCAMEFAKNHGIPPEKYLAPLRYLQERHDPNYGSSDISPSTAIPEQLVNIFREFSHFAGAVTKAHADGEISADEMREVEKELNEFEYHKACLLKLVREARR